MSETQQCLVDAEILAEVVVGVQRGTNVDILDPAPNLRKPAAACTPRASLAAETSWKLQGSQRKSP